MSQFRCETCNYYEDDDDKAACNIREEWISEDVWNWIKVVGCASHNDFKDEQHKLDVDTLGTILNVMEKDFDKLTTMERRAYSKAKSVELHLRQQEEQV